MKRWCRSAMLLVLALPAAAHGQYGGLVPKIVTISTINRESGQVIMTSQVSTPQFVPVQIIEKVNQNGQIVEVVKTTYRQEFVTTVMQHAWSAKESKAFDGAGKPLAGDEVMKRLKPGSAVLVHRGPGTVNAAYLSLLRPEAVILVMPAAQPAPVGPIPVPVPLPPVPVPLPIPVEKK